jgi:hypothetical protein
VAKVERWPEADLQLEEVDDGLLVSQGERTYLARKWRLTPELCQYVNLCLEHGLRYVIRYDARSGQALHPREENLNIAKGAQYLDFSRSKYDRWVVGIDQYSGRPNIKQIVCEKSYRRYVKETAARWVCEAHGGQNIFFPFEDLPLVLAVLTPAVIQDVEQALAKRDRTRARIVRTSVITEDDLQELVVESVASNALKHIFGSVTHYTEKPRLASGPANRYAAFTQDTLIPDLILFNAETCFILELKKGSGGLAELHQLLSYMVSDGIKTRADGRAIHGVLIAARYSDDALQKLARLAIRELQVPLVRFEFDRSLTLTPEVGARKGAD